MSVLVLPEAERPPVTPIPFFRLVAVELRKTYDTRAARGVMGTFVAIGALLFGVIVRGDATVNLASAGIMGVFAGIAVPLVTAQVMTSEWGQRTAMTTFWLETRRLRVLLAKVVAAASFAIMLVTALMVVSLAFLAIVVSARGQSLEIHGLGEMLRTVYGYTISGALLGVAWGALFMSTPITLVFLLVISLLVDVAVAVVLGDLSPWLSSSTLAYWIAGEPVLPAQVLTSAVLWQVAPLSVGLWLQTRREVR